jgi:hypothetical protein
MGLIREPKNVDFVIESKPWNEDELNQLRAIMKKRKTSGIRKSRPRSKEKQPAP